jgi:hypothetical protein
MYPLCLSPGKLESSGHARRRKLDFEGAVGRGVFSRLGKGSIDLERFLPPSGQYFGWAVAEPDVI